MKWLRSFVGFIRGLMRGPGPQGRVKDTPEMETEIERRRGVRGD